MSKYEKAELTNMCMIYDNAGRVVVQDKVGKSWGGITFPGGHVEKDESFVDSVIREVKEETGLDIQSPKLCGIKWWEAGHGRRYIILLFKTDRYSGTLHDSNEGKVFWAELDALRSMRLAPSFDKMLDVFTNEDIQEYIQRKGTDGWMDGYFEMTKQEMMATVYRQLALDYNCQPEDFTRSGILFTEAKMQRGRREMPFVTPRLEVITMGKSTVVNASKSVMPYVKQKFRNKSSYEILTDKLVYGANPYYLPDIEHIKPMENAACSFVLLDKDLHGLYKNKGFPNALQYDRDSARPEVLAAVAYVQEQIVGIACVSADSQTMWQIGVDVRPAYRGNGIGVKLVNMLTIETLARGVVPYYTTDIANISSQKVAVKSGYLPAWTHCFRNRLPKFHK